MQALMFVIIIVCKTDLQLLSGPCRIKMHTVLNCGSKTDIDDQLITIALKCNQVQCLLDPLSFAVCMWLCHMHV